jgi:hypothetical protein
MDGINYSEHWRPELRTSSGMCIAGCVLARGPVQFRISHGLDVLDDGSQFHRCGHTATFAAGNDIKDIQMACTRENIWWVLVARVPYDSCRVYCMVHPFPLLSPFRPESLFAGPLEAGAPATGLDAPGTGGAGADVLAEGGTGFG